MRVGLALVVDLLIISAVAHVAGPEAAACAALIIMRWEAGALGRDG
jgi:hypothetical protein